MPRRQNTGPGPRSKTFQSKNKSFLGESTATEASDAESFQSVELEPNHTDYGFDYTSNSSPRTTRTINRAAAASGEEEESRRSGRRSSSIAQNTRNSPRAPTKPKKKKTRKQENPLKRERKVWKEIRELQKGTDDLIPKAPFGRVIREILMQESSYANRLTYTALQALQTSCEIYLTNLFADAYICTLHRGRVTLGVHDVRLVRYLRGPLDTGNK